MTMKDLIDRARKPAFMDRLRRQVASDKALLDRLGADPVPGPVHGHLTTDRADPRLTHGVDETPVAQAAAYLVLSEDERARGFVRPLRLSYIHLPCGAVTKMNQTIAETYARDPKFYGATYCVHCAMHKPVGPDGEFMWDDGSGQKVGT